MLSFSSEEGLPLSKASPAVKSRLLIESVVSVHGVNILFAGY